MTRSRRGLTIGLGALTLALMVFAVTALQFGLVIEHALAQSSVRPPDSAVNVEEPAVVPAPVPSGEGGATSSVRPPENAASNAPAFPGVPRARDAVDPSAAELPPGQLQVLGPNSDASLWAEVRQGAQGNVSIPDKKLGVLVQPRGTGWGEWRAKGGPLQEYGAWAIGGMVLLLAVFFLIRGRVRIRQGRSGVLIERFKGIERFSHWMLAVSFILLALTGLNLLYGKDYLIPLVGKEGFATVTFWGKWLHNNIAWPFMLALVLIFVFWVWHNFPSWTDVKWIAKGGGIIGSAHPHARKFNAGQKIVFWATILLGASVSLSGIALLFPYELPLFAKTFAILNGLGVEAVWGETLRTDLTPMEEQQYAQIWHSLIALTMIAIIIAHIYIGTLGMEGAFDAMGTGWVDRAWAEEHHDLWVEEKDRKAGPGAHAGRPATHPAE